MNKSFGKLILIAGLIFSHCVFAETVEKRYEVSDHGALLLNVPDTWEDQASSPIGGMPSTVRFTQKAGEQFAVLFTPMWNEQKVQSDPGTAQGVRGLVEGAAAEASSQAEEDNLEVKELGGANIGYYFSATDRAPKPGEYKYMTQGAVEIDGIMVTFTILTHDANSNAVEQAIKMFAGSRHTME